VLVYSYLEMMQKAGPSERIFKEIQKIEILDFEHREEKHPMDNVESLCENMHFYPPERYLGRKVMYIFADSLKVKSLCENIHFSP
jgi:nardilysin